MKFEDICKQLPSKRRSVSDLARFINTRTDGNPNYSLLLGAGCSVTSGIRSAAELMKVWRKEICLSLQGGDMPVTELEQKNFLKNGYSDWYDPTKEYSSLFEKRFDLQRQRRMFVESEVSKGFPSIGYAYLTSLIDSDHFRVAFTTNFDDLLNEAFYLYSDNRPIVCAHDSSINSVTVTSKRPKIIKLHGDYLFDDLKATLRETETLEQNMKAKFVEFAKDSGLIVVGYSGIDRSIMDVLNSLLKSDDYFRAGIYWCVRSGSDIPEELRRLFWKDRVYFVEIDGFDELFSELYAQFNPGMVLPESTLTTVRRPNRLAEKLLENSTRIPETTKTLIAAKDQLSRYSKRTTIANLIFKADREDSGLLGRNQDMTDDEMLALTEAENLISDGKYLVAINKIKGALEQQPRLKFKRKLLIALVNANRLNGDDSAALVVIDQIILSEPLMASNYLLKSRVENRFDIKLEYIDKAIAIDRNAHQAYYARASLLSDRLQSRFGENKRNDVDAIVSALNKCLKLNPSVSNRAWGLLYDRASDLFSNKEQSLVEKRRIISLVEEQGDERELCLKLKSDLFILEEDFDGCRNTLSTIESVEKRLGVDDCLWALPIKLRLLGALGEFSEVRCVVEKNIDNGLAFRTPEVAVEIASVSRKILGDEVIAENVLSSSLRDWDFDGNVLTDIVDLLIDVERIEEAEAVFEKWENKVVDRIKYSIRRDIALANREYDKAILYTKKWSDISNTGDRSKELYVLLCAKRYQEANELARAILEPISYSIDAYEELINYEISRKAMGKKVDQGRLDKVSKMSGDKTVNAAVFALIEDKNGLLDALKGILSKNKMFRYSLKQWPVFELYRNDPDVNRLLEQKIPA